MNKYGIVPDPVGEGQESIWDYPRPPRLEKASHLRLKMVFNGVVLAETTNVYSNKETSHPPCYYFHPNDLRMEFLRRDPTRKTVCEYKGVCTYWDLEVDGKVVSGIGFSYDNPKPKFNPIKGWISFYAGPMDACFVNGEEVIPEPAEFYSGWITNNIVGPFRTQ